VARAIAKMVPDEMVHADPHAAAVDEEGGGFARACPRPYAGWSVMSSHSGPDRRTRRRLMPAWLGYGGPTGQPVGCYFRRFTSGATATTLTAAQMANEPATATRRIHLAMSVTFR